MPMSSAARDSILSVDSIVSGYGKKKVLEGVSLTVGRGEIVALIGNNGAGKSTLLKAVFGLIPIWRGRILFDGASIENVTPRGWLARSVAYVPQGNRVFNHLTVSENLKICGDRVAGKQQLKDGIERALTQFPVLRDRLNERAGILSGGEKQMLALSCALVLSPSLLLLDEPSLGLAPPLVLQALDHIERINRSDSITVVIVEQKVREVLQISHRVYVLRSGSVSFSGRPEELKNDAKLRSVFL